MTSEIKACGGKDGESQDEMRPEPIVLLPFIEHHLQAPDTERQQSNADVVELYSCGRAPLCPGRVIDETINERQGHKTDGQVEEENPTPGVIVRNPSSQRGADRRGDDCRDAVEGEGQAALLGGKHVRQDRLRHRLQSTAAGALQDAKQNDRPETRGNPAQQRANCENCQAYHEESLAPKQAGKPSADREHDGVGDEVRG